MFFVFFLHDEDFDSVVNAVHSMIETGEVCIALRSHMRGTAGENVK